MPSCLPGARYFSGIFLVSVELIHRHSHSFVDLVLWPDFGGWWAHRPWIVEVVTYNQQSRSYRGEDGDCLMRPTLQREQMLFVGSTLSAGVWR